MGNELEKISSNNLSVSGISGQELLVAKMVSETATEITKIAADYAKCKQEQITERERIKAQLKAFTTQILAEKEKYIYGIKKYYESNQQIYTNLLDIVKSSCEKGDMESMKMAYEVLLQIYNSSIEQLKIVSGMTNDNSMKFIE